MKYVLSWSSWCTSGGKNQTGFWKVFFENLWQSQFYAPKHTDHPPRNLLFFGIQNSYYVDFRTSFFSLTTALSCIPINVNTIDFTFDTIQTPQNCTTLTIGTSTAVIVIIIISSDNHNSFLQSNNTLPTVTKPLYRSRLISVVFKISNSFNLQLFI